MKKYNSALWNSQIDKIAKYYNLINYIGTYSRNHIPSIFFNPSKSDMKCIINNKPDNEDGEHWLALITNNNKTICYDSFGRKNTDFNLKFKMTDDTPEQGIYEFNCGHRCIAFLLCCQKFGIDETIKII